LGSTSSSQAETEGRQGKEHLKKTKTGQLGMSNVQGGESTASKGKRRKSGLYNPSLTHALRHFGEGGKGEEKPQKKRSQKVRTAD